MPTHGTGFTTLPGRAFDASMTFWREESSDFALAAITTGTRPIKDTGTKSRSASKGMGWYSAMLAAKALAAIIMV